MAFFPLSLAFYFIYNEQQAVQSIATLYCIPLNVSKVVSMLQEMIFVFFVGLKYELACSIRVFPGEWVASAELDCQLTWLLLCAY